MTEYDLKASKRNVQELYPILVDAHGNMIDGFHRLEEDPGWERKRLEHIRTPTQLWLARIIANAHRRTVSREERSAQITKLADSLMEFDGVAREDIVKTVAELTTFSERYVQMLLPPEYKRFYGKSEPSSDMDRDLVHPAEPISANIVDEDEADRGVDAHEAVYGEQAEAVPVPQPEPSPMRYIAECFRRHSRPDLDFLAWDVARRYGLTESEARSLIKRYRGDGQKPARKPESRKTKIEPDVPETTTCPLCGRAGADLNLVVMKMEEHREFEPDKPAWKWIEEALKR